MSIKIKKICALEIAKATCSALELNCKAHLSCMFFSTWCEKSRLHCTLTEMQIRQDFTADLWASLSKMRHLNFVLNSVGLHKKMSQHRYVVAWRNPIAKAPLWIQCYLVKAYFIKVAFEVLADRNYYVKPTWQVYKKTSWEILNKAVEEREAKVNSGFRALLYIQSHAYSVFQREDIKKIF